MAETMTKAEHEACREIERIIARVEFQHDSVITRIGLARNDDGGSCVWFDSEKRVRPEAAR